MRIYLADLGHNQVSMSSDVYPLGVANLAMYLKAFLKTDSRLETSIFREPQDLKAALDAASPDILALSSYSWNHNLALSFARYAKARNPKVVTLMGGPNFPLTAPEQESFLRGMPEVDAAVRGPVYEGERAFLNVVQRFSDSGCTLEGLQEGPVPGNAWINRRSGDFVMGPEVERIRELDEIPSPYLAGLMDPFLKTGYFPLLQIARGCPFTCSYCNSAPKSNNRIFAHSVQNVRDDLLYIAKRVKPELPVCFADDNFAMYERDEQVADYIAELQDEFGWPRYVRTTTGKNRADRIIRVMRKTRGGMPMTAAVQSMNSEVLKNIERDNISLDSYALIQKEVLAQGMQSYGELILCLPGESRESFMKGVHDLLEAGVQRISAHQLMLLHGAPLSNPDSRERFGFKTRFRLVARDVGNYTGEPIMELEEMVVETPSFSFDDYLETRVFHLLMTIYFYEGNFEEAFAFARQEGIKSFDLFVRLQAMLEKAPKGFQDMIREFRRESREELFYTKEECREAALRHFPDLVSGAKGGNLLSKYSMLGRFYVVQEAVDFLEAGISAALGESASEAKRLQLAAIMDFLRCVVLKVPFAQSLDDAPRWITHYDIQAWSKAAYAGGLEAFKFPEARSFDMAMESDKKTALMTRVATFGEHPAGLGKFTRTMFARDLRRSVQEPARA